MSRDILQKKDLEAFSLIELSIILTVLALFAAGILSTQHINVEHKRIESASEETDYTKKALLHFAKKNGYVPCPARRDLAPEDPGFGLASDCNAAATAGLLDVTPSVGAATDAVRIGMLPVRTLGLPERYAFDPWDSRYTYAVVKKLAVDASTFNSFTTTLTTGIIRVNDSAGAQILPASTHTYTSYVLLRALFSDWGGCGQAAPGRSSFPDLSLPRVLASLRGRRMAAA